MRVRVCNSCYLHNFSQYISRWNNNIFDYKWVSTFLFFYVKHETAVLITEYFFIILLIWINCLLFRLLVKMYRVPVWLQMGILCLDRYNTALMWLTIYRFHTHEGKKQFWTAFFTIFFIKEYFQAIAVGYFSDIISNVR